MSDPSPDTPNAYAPRCGHHGNPLVWLDPALRWRCPHCFPELFPAARPAPGSSSPDTAALVSELRGPSGLTSTSRAKHLTVGVCAVAADALEAQASRITELEQFLIRLGHNPDRLAVPGTVTCTAATHDHPNQESL